MSAAVDTWHRLEARLEGVQLTASLDGAVLCQGLVSPASIASGWAVIGTGGYDAGVQFDNFFLNA